MKRRIEIELNDCSQQGVILIDFYPNVGVGILTQTGFPEMGDQVVDAAELRRQFAEIRRTAGFNGGSVTVDNQTVVYP